MDLAIRNGTVVTPSGSFVATVGVADGRIAQVRGDLAPAPREFDASGLLVLPGCVDIHTHLSTRGGLVPIDDFGVGTRAAAAGGVTTVCDFAWQQDGEGLIAATQRALADARRSIVDFTFHTVVVDPSPAAIADLGSLADGGFAGLKVFMPPTRFTRRTGDYLRLLRAAGENGLLTAIHAEDESIVSLRTEELLAAGKHGVEWFPESRPPLAEEIAVRRAIAFCEATGAPIYLVHLSSRGALAAVREARARGLPVYAETRPIYLYLTRESFVLPGGEGAKFVGQPPLREREDVEALWHALRAGHVSTVCTDHYPHTLAAKLAAPGFDRIPPGMSNLETLLPMLYSEGVAKGRLSVGRMVEVLAANPARIAGLAPRKGTLLPGADADIVLFDPHLRRMVRSAEMQSAADYDVFEGWEVTGWPVTTISRGEVIFDRGAVTAAEGRGEFVPRARFSSL